MKKAVLVAIVAAWMSVISLAQQISQPVPRLIRFGGVIANPDGTPRTGVVGVMFSFYADQQRGTALWTELQNVTLDGNGQYTVLLGSQHSDGVPAELFTSNEARWLGVQVEAAAEQPRVLLVSVPYALKAGDAEMLGGKPLSAFVLNPEFSSDGTTNSMAAAVPTKSSTSTSSSGVTTFALDTGGSAGTVNYLARWTPDGSTLGSSLVYDNGSGIGLGMSTPESILDIEGSTATYVKLNNQPWGFRIGSLQNGRQFIGMAVKKTGADDNYIATSQNNPAVAHSIFEMAFDGSFHFKQQAHQPDGTILTPNETLTIAPSGYVGIGTVTPASPLTVTGTIQSLTGGFMFPDGSVLSSATNILPGAGGIGIGIPTPESILDVERTTADYIKLNNQPWGLRIGSLQNGRQFIGMAVKKTAADDNYIATSENNPYVAHSIFEMAFDGSFHFKQQAHQPDGTILTPNETFTIAPSGYVGVGTATPESILDIESSTANYVKLNNQPWGFRIGSLQNGRQFIGMAVRKTAADDNYIATSQNNPAVAHSIFEMAFDGSFHFKQQAHQPDGTILTPNETFTIAPSGYVGVGTATPAVPLTVNGTIQSLSGGFMFPDGSVLASGNNTTGSTTTQVLHITQTGAGAGSLTILTLPAAIRGDSTTTTNYTSGVLGTSASSYGFGVVGGNLANSSSTNDYAIGVFGVSTQSTIGTGVWGEAEAATGSTVGVFGKSFSNTATKGATGVFGYATGCVPNSQTGTCSVAPSGDGVGVYGLSDSPNGTGVWGDATTATSGATWGVYGSIKSSTLGASAGVFDNLCCAPTDGSGAILIGRSGSNQTKVFRVDTTGKGFFNGGTQTLGADFAESVDVLGTLSDYKPGDVLIIDPSGYRRLALASEPYSTKVAGIYSTKPGVLATPHMMDDPRLASEVPLAVIGIVPCKVSTENGAIEPGDLLVASSTRGYAMKGTDRTRMLGAVIGKAMQSLKQGSGVIEVLVSLH